MRVFWRPRLHLKIVFGGVHFSAAPNLQSLTLLRMNSYTETKAAIQMFKTLKKHLWKELDFSNYSLQFY